MEKHIDVKIELVLIRHGETAANREHRYLGRTEEPLSETGREQLFKDKRQGKYPEVDILFVSPMRRCLETAEILYKGVPVIEIPELREMDFGAFEGKNYLELKDNPRYQAWLTSNGALPFPEGESREEFIERTSLGLEKIAVWLREKLAVQLRENENRDRAANDKNENVKGSSDAGKRPQVAGAIVHGGTIMALLSRFHGGEYFDYQVSNGSGYRCRLQIAENELRITELEKIE